MCTKGNFKEYHLVCKKIMFDKNPLTPSFVKII